MRPAEDDEPTTDAKTQPEAGDDGPANAGETPANGRFADLPERYRAVVETFFDESQVAEPAASLVVVTYQTDRDAFESVLSALRSQTDDDFELVVVDNGVEWNLAARLREVDGGAVYAELVRNCGVTLARNLGARLGDADFLLFLDDDAVPASDFVAAHRCAHAAEDIVAVRGRVVPQSRTFYNSLQRWYDLGDRPRPFLLNIEGNTSIDRDAYRSVSGFDEELGGRAGHEGIDLTYRLMRAGYDRESVVYRPEPVVYHDYATSLLSYLEKRIVSRCHRKRLSMRRPELFEFAGAYSPPDDGAFEQSPAERFTHLALDAVTRLGSAAVRLKRALRPR
ncbi:glycosyltransferase [Halogeometricum pallidum JCM 14848]|uniref:Glycosyltransferase n=1 Tax=Halogeometricum pallidum JCM 14848 TaxID=1227487 RepID=M0DAH9_HALPD|nr:glycosyltransferase [Halogeometricum pallidum]ELZ31808.1 glycosyltransferase [Halogeometricum pallidum JCM 14848]